MFTFNPPASGNHAQTSLQADNLTHSGAFVRHHPVKSHRWQLLSVDETAVERLQAELGLDALFCRLLLQRGIDTKEEARHFFKPLLEELHDPFLMKDMDLAVKRLDEAVLRNERILLYGDYDVDGTTSVALMYAFLSGFHKNLDYYLPDRDKEGYGVSLAGVEYARETGCNLVVAMDCGIKAQDAVAVANTYGIDFIICDHHVPEGGLPASVANLDPKRPDCPYPYKELSGCGIAFKLAQALARHHNTPSEEIEHLLDLVAVSIACDIVPITGENRILAFHGLHRLNHDPRTGLWAIISRLNRAFPLTVSDLVFGLGPIINAAGRLGDARDAVRLLLATDRNAATLQAATLIDRNRERREVDYAMAGAAQRRFQDLSDWQERKSVVLFDPEWHKGIIGIAASRMTETFHRPSVILTQSNDRAVGSARSVRGFDLYWALQQCEDLFYSYGGHAHAAGMQMPVENVPAFTERFEELVRTNLSEDDEDPVIEISARIRLEALSQAFWRVLRRFEPFGPQNRSPVFQASRVVDSGKSRVLQHNHVRLLVRQEDGKKMFGGIGYGLGAKFETLKDRPFDIVFSVREEHWRGETTLALYVKDIRETTV